MISETLLSRSYSSFWSEVTPWLNSYTQLINKRYLSQPFSSLPDMEDPKLRSISGILSFNFYRAMVETDKPTIDAVLEASRVEIERFPGNNLSEYSIDDTNTKIVEGLANRLYVTFDEDLVFKPRFNGCGILSNCEADLLAKDALVEIKTGDRHITASDVRQLLIYVGLNQISGTPYDITEVKYFNPRKGALWRSNVDDLFRSISTIPLADFSSELENFLLSQSEDFNLD